MGAAGKQYFSSYLFVIIAAVVRPPDDPRTLLCVRPNEVDLRVVEDLVVLVWRQLVNVQLHHLLWCCHHCLWFRQAVLRPIGVPTMLWALQGAVPGGVSPGGRSH